MKTFIWLCSALLFLTTAVWGQTPLISLDNSGNPKAPWHITADTVSYDDKTEQYAARGNVIIQKQNRRLTADRVLFDHKNMQAIASGHIVLTAGKDVLTGSWAELDLNSETGRIFDGTLFIETNHFYIKGNEIKKTGPETYTVDKGSLTSCDGPKPAWRITGRKLKVTIEGYGTVQHATVWARSLPVAYTPFLVFPVKLKRQTGLLPPQMGYSDRKGEYYIQPFFWAINDQSDATFYWHHLGQRGEKLGIEYRYALSEYTQGAIMFDYFNDRQIDDGQTENTRDWGYSGDSADRTNTDRYWFRMKHDQLLPLGFLGRLDLDIVSDQDYLHEFITEYTGYGPTDAYFANTFGRTLDDYNDPVRVNSFSMIRTWSQFNLIAETRWYDDVIARRSGTADTTIQKLPYIEFAGIKQRIFNSPFFYDLNSTYEYFYRQEGARSHRADIYPRLYLPLQFREYLSIEPSAGVRETAWLSENDTTVDSIGPQTRHLYDFSLDLSTDIYRIYDLKDESNDPKDPSADRLKHSLRPQIVYTYIPDIDQDQYPSFDDSDRIEASNLITYSITNWLSTRTPVVTKGRKIKNDIQQPYKYRQVGRLKVEQSFDINKSNEGDPEPFSDVDAELTLHNLPYWWIRANTTWSPYTYSFPTRNIAIQLEDDRKDALTLEYRYTEDQNDSIRGDLKIQLTRSLSTYINYEHNLMDDKLIDMNFGFVYESQCWTLQIGYGEEGEFRSRKVAFWLVLHGLGGIGTK